MRTLYLDCQMGAAGDMLTAALIELLPNPDEFIDELNGLGIPGVVYQKEKAVKCSVAGTQIHVLIKGEEEEPGQHPHDLNHHGHRGQGHHHHHSSLHDIEQIVRGQLSLPVHVQDDILAVYQLIAEAESRVHGVPVPDIHFHEVGTMDAVADITAVCLLMDRLAPDEVTVSAVCTGSGQVRCAHGILPVPAPATAHILQGIPIYSGSVKGELCTPTGAALLRHFATRFGQMPVMRPAATGYGMGHKDFEAVNCIRAILGDTDSPRDEVCELRCNVDDMTAEALGFALERLFEAGALDVYTAPAGMKKNRPGTLICALCRKADEDSIVRAMFQHTTTIGIREIPVRRFVLERRRETKETPFGPVRRKVSWGWGVNRRKYEYDDIARIAREQKISFSEALALIGEPAEEIQTNKKEV